MSLLTHAYLIERFGVRLNMKQLGEVCGWAENTIFNRLAKGDFPITTYVDGGKRFADYRDVADHLDVCRSKAQKEPHAVL